MGKARTTKEGSAKGRDKTNDKAKKEPPPPAAREDDYDEDGDIATPKLDRYGNDDEPL